MSSRASVERTRRNLNPHKGAVVAMWLWGARYARTGLGSMDFWDSLTDSERQTCRRLLANVEDAPDE